MTQNKSAIAALQMASGPVPAANLLHAEESMQKAAAHGAQLIVLPENFAFMGRQDAEIFGVAEQPGDGPVQAFLAEQARKLGVWIVGGTVPLKAGDDERVFASTLVFDEQGECRARYDKIHLFDVHVAETDEDYRESDTYQPGEAVQVLDSPVGRLGLAICYDLRFPELFRALTDKGIEVLALPAAFTHTTGQAHWDILVRARAVENLCYVAAAAQGGIHASGRQTYGHSMVVDPWGRVLDEVQSGAGVAQGDVDLERLANLRASFPALQHRRLKVVPEFK